MEIKAKLQKPYEEPERISFIVIYNHNQGYEIRETEEALEAWGYTEEEKQEQERQKIDSLTLTPADVERALYKEKGMDFDDLKALIVQALPTVDIKALSIEFRAKDFYRGAMAGGVRLFDTVGALLGYTPQDMDYLFINKQLPIKEEENESTTNNE
jgi:hypothetical protein